MSRSGRATLGLVGAVALVAAAVAVPLLTGWEVHAGGTPPLWAWWWPRTGPGTVPALLVGAVGGAGAWWAARRLPWGGLLLTTYVVTLAWSVSLASIAFPQGLGRVLASPQEYLRTARAITDVGTVLQTWVARMPLDAPDSWTTHVAGHPPGTTLFFWGLVQLGLGAWPAAGAVVILLGATTPVTVLATVRRLTPGRDQATARAAAPFLALGPAAIWMVVSADAVLAAAVAAGTLVLTRACTSPRWVPWSLLAGLLAAVVLLLSYGLALTGLLALAVALVTRRWRPLLLALPVAAGLVAALGLAGFDYLDALRALPDRYWAGVAAERPEAYWLWANLAAFVIAAGPAAAAALAALPGVRRDDPRRPVVLLVLAGWAMVLAADASRMSKAEVERIWLPFVPWVLLAAALLPPRWRAPALWLQILTALAVQHLVRPGW